MKSEFKERIEKIRNGEVPEGYKKTESLVLPSEWDVKKIKDISNIYRGASPRPISDPKWFDDNSKVGWVRISDVSRSNKILSETEQYLSEMGVRKSRLVVPHSLIMSICATVGKPMLTTFPVCIHDGFVVFENLAINKEYFYYLLEMIENRWKRYGQTGSQMNLNTNIVGSERISIPKSEMEQQQIANILSTWDKAIELKEKLIQAKKEQKRGLMQTLLSGKKRVKGFSGEWKEVSLGELGNTYTGLSGKKSDDFGEGKPYIPYKNIFNNSKIDLEYMDYVKMRSNEKQNLVKKGDVFFTTSSEIPEEVGMTSVLLNDVGEMYLNSFCFGYRLKNSNYILPEFLRFCLRGEDFRKEVYRLAQGSTRYNISKNEIMKIIIKVPTLKEQYEMIQILDTGERAIYLLEKELEVLKQQKKGLVQLLLTGIVRVNQL